MPGKNGVWGEFEGSSDSTLHEDTGEPEEREYLEKKIIQCLSGPAAECKYTLISPFKAAGTDLLQAVKLACMRYTYQTEADLLEEMTKLWGRTKELIYDGERWEYIERIAQALEEQLTVELERRMAEDDPTAKCTLNPQQWKKLIDEVQAKRRGFAKTEVMTIIERDDFYRVESLLSDRLKP